MIQDIITMIQDFITNFADKFYKTFIVDEIRKLYSWNNEGDKLINN